jgi:hypothetical protein
LNSYLTEFMWRKNFTSVRYEATEAIIDAIAESHSLESDDHLIENLKKHVCR